MPKGKKEEKQVVDDKFQPLDISTKDPRTAILMLDSPEGLVTCTACQALHKHIEKSEQNCTEVQNYDILPKLVGLLSSTEKAVKASALVCLSAMTHSLNVRRSLLKLQCVAPLLDMLKPETDVVILERATFVISQLAEEYSFKQLLQEQNACQYLIGLLSQLDCDLLKNSIKSLSLLTSHYTSRKSMIEENGFPPVLALLDSEYSIIQELSLQTLHNCLQDVQCRDQFRESGGLSKLTEFLNNQEWNDLHALAVDVLSLCLLKPKGLEELHSSNCLQRLLESINNSQLPLMKTKATLAIARASADITSQKLLHDQHAEKVFIQLLTSQDESVLCAACEALIQLSSFASSRLTIGLEEGIPKLIQLTQHAGPNVRCSAVHALSSVITEAPSNAIIAGEAGAIEHIVSLLSDDLALSRVYAISCVINMSPNGTLRSEIIEQGAISALVQCMPHIDSYVQQTALEAIALLAVDSVARQQFPIEDVPCLVNLLVSSNTDVSRCAAWAISMLAYNRKIAENVLKSNGLDILQQLLKQSTHRDVLEHSQIAIDRLLVGCLPAQYYIKGYLSFHDTLIGTEFWDVGMAETDRGFLTLEDLVAIAPQLNKPVLVVLLTNPPPPVENVVEDTPSHGEIAQTSSKSRQVSSKIMKKSKNEKTPEVRPPTEEAEEGQEDKPHPPEGLLPSDVGLWKHVAHVQQHIQPLTTISDQTKTLALYVANSMGGAVRRGTNIQFELQLAKVQALSGSNVVPIGAVVKGSFQHRSLLFKVLADHLGIPCSLNQGDYGRYWNTVLCEDGEMLVDLMYMPGKLLNEQEGAYYKSI